MKSDKLSFLFTQERHAPSTLPLRHSKALQFPHQLRACRELFYRFALAEFQDLHVMQQMCPLAVQPPLLKDP